VSDTLAAPNRFEAEIRKSRFVARAAPIESGEGALAWLAQQLAPDATHHCWAYRIGQTYRHSDDGEPAGTAGRPILAAIDGQGFDQVMVVGARWYGGTKLGAGGLVRAYGGTAAECLRRAPRRPLIRTVDLELACAFAHTGAIYASLAGIGALRLAERFAADGVCLTLRVPVLAIDNLRQTARDATRGQATIRILTPT
jgi:putative IMPACT (imprinted ancient) family translation regulator